MRRWSGAAVQVGRGVVMSIIAPWLGSCIPLLDELRAGDDGGAPASPAQNPDSNVGGQVVAAETPALMTHQAQPQLDGSAGANVEVSRSDTLERPCEQCSDGITTAGSTVEDCATGEPCPSGIVSDAEATHCAPGERVASEGDQVGEQVCVACGPGTFSDQEDARSCLEWTQCDLGFRVVAGGTASSDRTCMPCEPGTFADEVNSGACQSWRNCEAPGEYVSREPSARVDRACSACESGAVSLADNASTCTTRAFQMQAGVAAFEAEHYHWATGADGDDWYELSLPGVSGDRCMEIGPDDHSDWTVDPFLNAPRLDYLVFFDRAGNYFVHVRGDAGANSDGFSDSCWVAVDGVTAEWYKFRVLGDVWGWETQSVGAIGVGLHTVSLLAREDGFRVDKIVVSLDSAPPSGNGPPQSAVSP